MITPEQLEAMVENLIKIYQDIEDDLLANIAGRLSVLDEVPQDSIAQWHLDKLQQLGSLRRENIRIISSRAGKTLKEIEKILTNAGYQAMEFDERIYQMAISEGLLTASPLPLSASPGIRQLIQAAIDNTRNYMNLINTTALESANQAFLDAVNKVYLEGSLGITDYNTSVRNAVRKLADQGITGATYVTQAGRIIRNHLDVAVKRCIVTSTRQTTGKLKIQRAREMGSNLVEVSSHIGARPEHAVWQGKIYSIEGSTAKYPNLAEATGYGTVTGLKGANCAHDFWPFIEGLSERTYFPVDDEENAQVYEQSQQQRKSEREIREQKRRAVTAEAAGDKEGLLKAQLALKDKEAQLKDFLNKTGRVRLKEREQVMGFGRSQASKAVWAKRKTDALARKAEEEYNKKQQEVIDLIRSDSIKKTLNPGNQKKHLLINREPPSDGRSYIYGDLKTAQELVDKHHGTGEVKFTSKGAWSKKEFVEAPNDIGVHVNPNTKEQTPTNRFSIHYSKKGTHVVPAKRRD